MAENWVPGNNTVNMQQAASELKTAFQKYGMQGIKPHFEKKLNDWKDVPLYIGVSGRPGVGKSSFINTIRGLGAEDEGAAAVGVTETTSSVGNYPHPQNELLVFCDMPGVGTPTFKKDDYFTDPRIGFDKYDMFLILTSDRFCEDDLWLAEGIKKKGKEFLFARTKIGQDVDNERKSRRAYYERNPGAIYEVINKIRADCETNLQGFSAKVFLIDNLDPNNPHFDFDSLTKHLIDNFPTLKREALILSLASLTPCIIKEKEIALRKRIWGVSCISAIGGAIPIPGVSLALDIGILLEEAIFYRKQFGLGKESLEHVAHIAGIPWEIFKEKLKLTSSTISLTTQGIIQFAKCLVISEGIETTVGLLVPIIGMIVGACISFASTKYVLDKLLDIMVKDAELVNEYITNSTVTSLRTE